MVKVLLSIYLVDKKVLAKWLIIKKLFFFFGEFLGQIEMLGKREIEMSSPLQINFQKSIHCGIRKNKKKVFSVSTNSTFALLNSP